MLLPVALRFAYDGGLFRAYARDPRGNTVEDHLEDALKAEGMVGSLRTGSRTDARVSALENVCAATLERPHIKGLLPALQSRLPDGLWVTGAAVVDASFRPRHARLRRYGYQAIQRGEDLDGMQKACQAFVGRHHMAAFARLETGRDPNRTTGRFTVAAQEPQLWHFTVEGDGFLWNQVRRMVSAVLCVGRGLANVDDIVASLGTGVAHKSFRLAAAEGLVLERVEHPGLAWDPAAGALEPNALARMRQAAAARSQLAAHLAHLAPWRA
ncbi:MAG: tRNA pseudouridine synthase A [Thermoplasmatota archaeon]